jgi:hypothetical protein
MANGQAHETNQEPDEAEIRRHLELLIAPAIGSPLQDGLVEIAYGLNKPNKARLFELDDLSQIAEFAARVNRAGHHIWVGMALRLPTWPRAERGTKAAFYGSHFAWMDDAADRPAAHVAAADCPPDVLVCTGQVPSWRGQLLWRFREAITDPELLEAINRGIMQRLGGDDVWNCDRLLRLAGSVNWPTKPGRTAPELVTFRW